MNNVSSVLLLKQRAYKCNFSPDSFSHFLSNFRSFTPNLLLVILSVSNESALFKILHEHHHTKERRQKLLPDGLRLHTYQAVFPPHGKTGFVIYSSVQTHRVFSLARISSLNFSSNGCVFYHLIIQLVICSVIFLRNITVALIFFRRQAKINS